MILASNYAKLNYLVYTLPLLSLECLLYQYQHSEKMQQCQSTLSEKWPIVPNIFWLRFSLRLCWKVSIFIIFHMILRVNLHHQLLNWDSVNLLHDFFYFTMAHTWFLPILFFEKRFTEKNSFEIKKIPKGAVKITSAECHYLLINNSNSICGIFFGVYI